MSRQRLGLPSGLLALALLFGPGCDSSEFSNFGNLNTPVSLAMHAPSGHLFIASQGSNDLRVLVPRKGHFLVGPAALFPLSIPTVRAPIAIAAADRYVFVVSGAGADVGFVDTVIPEGGVGPRSVDGPDGFPLMLGVDTVPTAVAAFTAAHPFADGLADHLILVGLSPDGDGGNLVVARPPHLAGDGTEPLPTLVSSLELPGIFPADVVIDPAGPAAPILDSDGAPIADCRTVAIADTRIAEDHRPGVWLTRARVEPNGSFSIEPVSEARRIELRIPVTLADGAVEERLAGARAVAFAPAPEGEEVLEALAADPCAQRSGRLFVVLDPAYCGGAVGCPNVAVVDLGDDPDQPGTLATDATSGGPAAYQLPGAQLGVVAISGPLNITGGFNPTDIDPESEKPRPIVDLPVLTLFTSTNGAVTYLAGGRGNFLQGPGQRAASDAPFLISSIERASGVGNPVRRTDAHQLSTSPLTPEVSVPAEARPRTESWIASFGGPLPGLEDLGSGNALNGDSLQLAPGASPSLRSPVLVQASADPMLADRLAPQGFGDLICEGYPVIEVSADGLSLVVDRQAPGFDNPEGCEDPRLRLAILPPKELPWTLTGSVTGFVGRTSSDPAAPIRIFSGDRLLFVFDPPEEGLPPGATFEWSTDSGFRFLQSDPGDAGLMPASMVSFLRTDGERPSWRVFVAYSGADLIFQINPSVPVPNRSTFYR